jgi:acyl transferase domain-containing protein
VTIQEVLRLPEDTDRTVQIVLSTSNPGRVSFEIYSLDQDANGTNESWKQHASGVIQLDSQTAAETHRVDVEQLKRACPTQINVSDYYRQLADLGLEYGPAFQSVSQIWQGESESLGEIVLPSANLNESQSYQLHPALLDACFQLLGAATPSALSADTSRVYVPVGLQSLKLHQAYPARVWAHVSLVMPLFHEDGKPKDTLNANLKLFGADGQLIAEVEGLQIRHMNREVIRRISQKNYDDWLYELAWERDSASAASSSPTIQKWIIFADQDGLGDSLAAELRSRGASYALVRNGYENAQLEGNN